MGVRKLPYGFLSYSKKLVGCSPRCQVTYKLLGHETSMLWKHRKSEALKKLAARNRNMNKWVKKKNPKDHRFGSIFSLTNEVFWVPFC